MVAWYPRQIELVMAVARDEPGSRLKARQYKQAEYAATELGSRIAPITERVRRRLADRGLGLIHEVRA
jgi:predicted nuclease with RNAse H fold